MSEESKIQGEVQLVKQTTLATHFIMGFRKKGFSVTGAAFFLNKQALNLKNQRN